VGGVVSLWGDVGEGVSLWGDVGGGVYLGAVGHVGMMSDM